MSDVVSAIAAPARPASFNPSASLVELETQLRTAVACADASNKTAGALILHMVEQRKQTVRSIANTVGKSAGWVHGMLVWARADYIGDPFGGPARKANRGRAVFSPAEQPDKIKLNGHAIEADDLGPAAQEQIAKALTSPAAPMFDYDPNDDPETQPGDSDEVIRRRGFLFRAAESAAMACQDKLEGLPIDDEMLAAARAAADDWNAVVAKLDVRLAEKRAEAAGKVQHVQVRVTEVDRTPIRVKVKVERPANTTEQLRLVGEALKKNGAA